MMADFDDLVDRDQKLRDIAERIDIEGLGYAVMGYFSPDSVLDWPVPQEIKDAWIAAEKDLATIEAYFEPFTEVM